MGCFPSKSHRTHVESQSLSPKLPAAVQELPPRPAPREQRSTETAAATAGATQSRDLALLPEQEQEQQVKIYIIYYSMYGHVEALARKMKSGVDNIEGAQGYLFRVPETLPPEVLEKMQAPAKDSSIPVITPSQLAAADAFLFGFPTRYGAMAAQMKAFFDSTGSLWRSQTLAGKPAGFFVSTGAQGGGQETTAWTAITQLVHHGMLYIPVGYTFGAGMFQMDDLRGGTPYGAGTFAGDGTRVPTETELQLAEHQGMYTAGIVKRLISAPI